MKRLQALLCLILLPAAFVNAQVIMPVWELHEKGESNLWVNKEFYTYQYNLNGQLEQKDSYLNWNSSSQQWSNKSTKIYNLNGCDSTKSIYGYNASNTLNDSMRYVRVDDCSRFDSSYRYTMNIPGAPTGMTSKSAYSYDINGRLTNITGYGFSPNSGWYFNGGRTWQYNSDGNVNLYTKRTAYPYPGGYDLDIVDYYYNNASNYYSSVTKHEELNVTIWNNQPEYDLRNYKVDSSLYYYNSFNQRDSVYSYSPIYFNDSLGQMQFSAWYLHTRKFYKYTNNQQTDSILTIKYNNLEWINDSITTYEYIGDWLYRKSTYRWYNNEWTKFLRITYGDPTGIEETAGLRGLKLYPNPANTDNTIISFTDAPLKPYTLELYSMDGKLLHIDKATDKVYTLNTSGLSNGIYLVKITTTEHTTTQRLCILK